MEWAARNLLSSDAGATVFVVVAVAAVAVAAVVVAADAVPVPDEADAAVRAPVVGEFEYMVG